MDIFTQYGYNLNELFHINVVNLNLYSKFY